MSTAAPARLRRIGVPLVLLILLLAGAGGIFLFISSRLGTHADGSHVTLVWPGHAAATHVATAGRLQIQPAPDLAAEGLQVNEQGIRFENEQQFVLRREKRTVDLKITAGKQPVETGRLAYVLFDDAGNELSRGALRPDLHIEAGKSGTASIVDHQVANAARIGIEKMP